MSSPSALKLDSRYPNYWRLWTASVVSNFGDGLSAVAYPWLASAVTRNPVQISLIGVASRLPWLVFTLPAGLITDRVDRRKLVAAMDTIRFAITMAVALFVLAHQQRLASPQAIAAGTAVTPEGAGGLLVVLYLSALGFGVAEVLRDNAAQTLMPSVVDKELLETANGRLWGAEQLMNSFVGPPLGGLFLAAAYALPFFVDAGTFAVSAALIFAMTGRFAVERPLTERKSFRGEIAEGVSWLWSHPLLRPMAIVLGILNALIASALATYVLFAQEILALSAAGFGFLMSAGAVGGVVGSLAASRVSKTIGPGTSLFTSLLGTGATLLLTGITSNAGVVWAMAAVGSFLAVLWNVITVSLRQSIIPDHLLGRVNSVYRLLAWGMLPLGGLLGGAIVAAAEPLGGRTLALRMPFLVSAAAHLGLFFFALPRLSTSKIEAARTRT